VAADSKAKFLHDAERFVLQGKAQQAIGEYLKIIKCDPHDVLILNTIGDLYLRQGKSSDANKYFSQVAENYVQNNFFLKAIAVYKKILNSDPDNLEISSIMASLSAKQGLNIDARNQYLRIAALLEKEGKSKEAMEAYEKIVELDPANATIQRKLAELSLSEGAKDKAHSYWIAAARAHAKKGDLGGAADAFNRALQLAPLDVDATRGFLDCCLKLNDLAPALNLLKQSLELAPDNLDFREMLGQAHLANKDPETAVQAFQGVVAVDDTRYENFFAVAKEYIERTEYDKAIACLGSLIPTLISRRDTERAVQIYQLVLQSCPAHVDALEKLASIYSATGDQAHYLEVLDKIVDVYVEKNLPAEAIAYVAKILDAHADSEKHQKLHRELFAKVYPGTPYVPLTGPSEAASLQGMTIERNPQSDQENPSEIVEVDLLLNYGLKDKAESLLLSLEERDPYNREVRLRLLAVFKGEKKYTEAARQCLLLAVLYRLSLNEKEAQSCLSEAKQLAPEMAEYEKDLEGFARINGIETEFPSSKGREADVPAPESEVDLSSDLLDIFFTGDHEPEEDRDTQEPPGAVAENMTQTLPAQTVSKPVQEQLQEVDFYIRLGFHDEARAKLDEIAKTNPNDPELAPRYQKLSDSESTAAQQPFSDNPDRPPLTEPFQTTSSDNLDIFSGLELDDALDRFVEGASEKIREVKNAENPPVMAAIVPAPAESGSEQSRLRTAVPGKSANSDVPANEMFADLMEEVSALSEQEVSKESFDDHFSLGIAYREMELTEEAIREFELALKIADLKQDSRQVIQCCGMLSTCFLKKGMPSSAVRWCQTGLNIVDISSHESIALRYDMGVAHSMSGSSERALECFDQIFSLDPGYRDVAQKIDELKGGFERHAP